MEIKHWVETTEPEANELYMMAITVATASYPSIEEQDAAILSGMAEFKSKLDEFVTSAYTLGRKYHEHHLNVMA